jgi:hypothetical protein
LARVWISEVAARGSHRGGWPGWDLPPRPRHRSAGPTHGRANGKKDRRGPRDECRAVRVSAALRLNAQYGRTVTRSSGLSTTGQTRAAPGRQGSAPPQRGRKSSSESCAMGSIRWRTVRFSARPIQRSSASSRHWIKGSESALRVGTPCSG